ncbi:HNH endonuclease signature motif containing protein [Methylotenera sp. N17]|uniref:HNH endonuclease signature motif containing protein n=1 Tax=Methylotenera sp. N17 TaxID=1502761 RepID=UPI001F3ECBAA|nr:HNH endonuclease signature motif containing protein [Methylotenera sp. N17]
MQTNSARMKYLILVLSTLVSLPVEAESNRSYKAKKAFKIDNPCPTTGRTKGSCPNYVIDHIKPLACGGSDTPENMQWQTKAEAKAKDKWERKEC